MATYPYTGRLTDLGEAPFPSARPRLWVSPENDAITPAGLGSRRPIPVYVFDDGSFTVDLIASVDLNPQSAYILRCEWFTTAVGGQEVLAGWSEWSFTALVGGGPISTMPDDLRLRVWFDEKRPPVERPGVIWIHPLTGDVRVWKD